MFVNDLDQAPLLEFDSLDSTMSEAAKLSLTQREEGLTIIAKHQQAGRGRRGRSWHSEDGAGLWATMILRPSRPAADWPSLGLVFAVSLAQTIESHIQGNIQLKWPNDLWFDGKKLAGILLEPVDDGAALAVGFGVNFTPPVPPESEPLRLPAIGLKSLCPEPPSPITLLREIRRQFSAPYNGWSLGSWETARAEFSARDVLVGSTIKWEQNDGAMRGVATGIDPKGQLLVTLPDGGGTISLSSAEVEKLRPKPTEP